MQSLGIFLGLMLTCYALLVSWLHCWRVKLLKCLTPSRYNIFANFYPLQTCKEGIKEHVKYLYKHKKGYFFPEVHYVPLGLKALSIHFVQRSQALLDGWERHVLMVEDIYVLCLADNALGPCVAGKDEGGPESNEEPSSPICSAKKWALWFQ